MQDKPTKPHRPKIEEITVESAIRLLQAAGPERLVQIRRDLVDPKKIINIIIHE